MSFSTKNKNNDMKNVPWYKKAEMIIGLSALIVSLIAVFVGVYSAYLDRSFSRASLWPNLEVFSIYSSSQNKFIYQINNVGTGPALIGYTRVMYKGKNLSGWNELAKLVGSEQAFSSEHIGQRVLPELAKIRQISSESEELAKNLYEAKEDTKIEICYCSVYDECWLVGQNRTLKEVASCKVPSGTLFKD